jgi:glycosyltransferase involved in cell wall biosynthesis
MEPARGLKVTIALRVLVVEPALCLSVQSLLRQLFPYWELQLMDDGSTDQALAPVTKLGAPRIKNISDRFNEGVVFRLKQAIN